MPRSLVVASLAALVPLLALPALAQETSPLPPDAEQVAAQAAWVKRHAIPIKTAQAGSGFEDMMPLKAMIGDARIVSLGEPTHGTREAFQFKHRMLEFLVEHMGFTIFSIEANMPEACALTKYIQTGEGDPRELISGMYFWTWNTDEVFQMVEWMRAWNAAHKDRTPLQFTGFDMQTSTVAAKLATDYLSIHAPDLAPRAEKAFQDAGALSMGGGPASGFASATGSFPVADAIGKKLQFSAWIRTEGVTGWCGAWWRCDTPAGPGGFNNMADKAIKGTTPWTRYQFELDVNPDTTNINFGFLLAGDGAAWVDDIEITLDGVKYHNPALFSFDFEDHNVRFLNGGGQGYKMARVGTSPHDGKQCLEIRKLETPALDPVAVMTEADAVVDEMSRRQAELAKASSETDARWAIQNARVVAQRARMFGGGREPGANVRDQCMADNVAWLLEQNPGQKIVLWAHNAHVSKGEIWGTRWMGRYLDDKFPGQMVVVGFATGTGEYTAIAGMGTPASKLRRDNPLQAPPAGSVEQVFAAADLPAFIVDLRQAPATDPACAFAHMPRTIRSIGAAAMEQQFAPMTAAELFDLLVWQAQTTASKPVPAP